MLLRKLDLVKVNSFWFDSYHKNREQAVEYGEPQGSVLEPVLFLIYVNNMLDNFQCTMVQYVDNCQFLLEGRVKNLNDITKAEGVLEKLKIILKESDY